jgi:hypothetical protein
MEKQQTGRYFSCDRRLLIVFGFIISAAINGISISADDSADAFLHNLYIVPQEQTIYCGSECLFSLIIPSVSPSAVQVENPDLPDGVSFVSMRRSDYASGDVQGSKIELWLSFSKAGTYTLPPLALKIANRTSRVPFVSVAVLENPAVVQPRMIIRFDNGTELASDQKHVGTALFSVAAGNALSFTVYLQYAEQIIQFTWDIPRDAIFTELKQYKITEGKPRGSDFTAKYLPVARFEWIPLVQGNAAVPGISITATAYSGERAVLKIPASVISVLPAEKTTENVNHTADYFANAFTDTGQKTELMPVQTITRTECKKRAAAISSVRYIFFIIDCILSAGTFVLLIITILLFLHHHPGGAAVLGTVLVFAAVGIVFCSKSLLHHPGIFLGGTVYAIPEQISEKSIPFEAGQRVHIVEKAGDWYYIRSGNSGGWVLQNTVIYIR